MGTLEKRWLLVLPQVLLGLTGPPSTLRDPGTAAVGARESRRSTVGIRSADITAITSAASRNNSRVAKEPHAAWADRVLQSSDRLTEFGDHLSEMTANRRHHENEMLAQQDENLHLQLALNKERRKGSERGSNFLEGSSSRAVSPPPTAPRRHLQPRQRYLATRRNPVTLLGDAEWDPARRSLLPLIQPWNIHTANESDLNDDDNDDYENGPPLRAYISERHQLPRAEHDAKVQRTLLFR